MSSHEDIISSLVSLRDEDGKPLLEEEIIDNLITLMIASHDTTATLLSHFVRLLARDAEICDKVLQGSGNCQLSQFISKKAVRIFYFTVDLHLNLVEINILNFDRAKGSCEG